MKKIVSVCVNCLSLVSLDDARTTGLGNPSTQSPIELPVILDAFERSTVSASVYSNPARRVLYISHASQLPVKIILQDLTGKLFLDQLFDDEIITLDRNDVPPECICSQSTDGRWIQNIQSA